MAFVAEGQTWRENGRVRSPQGTCVGSILTAHNLYLRDSGQFGYRCFEEMNHGWADVESPRTAGHGQLCDDPQN